MVIRSPFFSVKNIQSDMCSFLHLRSQKTFTRSTRNGNLAFPKGSLWTKRVSHCFWMLVLFTSTVQSRS